MDAKFKNVFEYKVIYIFTINDEKHRGYLKIGDATLHTDNSVDKLAPNSRELNQAAKKRIDEYTKTAGITYQLLHTELAVYSVMVDGKPQIKAFRDHDVHAVLKNSGIDNVAIGETTGREWFEVDLETAKKAIDAVKKHEANLSNTNTKRFIPIVFRPEQEEAINKTVKQFKVADRMLWNAKMRFGKTVCALEVVRQMGFAKTIIITHRPVVNDGWYEDFGKIFHGNEDYVYGSKANGYTAEQLLKSDKKFVYFASIQDLRGSAEVDGKFEKNEAVFKTKWDCAIVDEAHEGTTTALGDKTVNAIVKPGTKFLALSGTPFNILTEFDENSIYTWDYIMEQENKSEWDKLHFGDSNPYDELPELRIYTYDLGDVLVNKNYISFEDKAFNFHEFFRTWTGDYKNDYADMPEGAKVGDFVHEADVQSFLNLMTREDKDSCYPFSNEEYRSLFRHTLWMVPGVREARALKKLMLKHPVFGSGVFDIVNVAGNGDEEEDSEEALSKVRNAIKSAGKDGYTITLSCGKLTTGVTVREWTAVFMLAGSFSTSAANYLQTIFRVQSPCNMDGKIKEVGYVFDFAPDRTLKMVASAVSVSAKAGKTKIADKQMMGKFLNYCPVISISGSQMQEYNANKLLQQLKRAYAEKVVQNGFDDTSLYNDELFKLQEVDIKKFDELKGIIGKSKAEPKAKDITVNDQGLTNEEYEQIENLQKKKKKDLTPEEQARLDELKKLKKLRTDAISILRSISIRMPLLIYGADIPYDEEITLDRFIDVVDDSSWDEFMPNGVTKEVFKDFQKYYDEEVFIAAGRRIRNIAREADTLEPTERTKKIASLFSYFKNPDKETVLTPWRVVNMHMSDCLGGWDFWDEQHTETLNEPRFVNRGEVTKNIFDDPDTKILEINSKTGLYPLYMTYSVYREKCRGYTDEELSLQKKNELWTDTVERNVFVICKTPMAKAITKRTLIGYRAGNINAHYFDDLINTMRNKPEQFISKVCRVNYWKIKGDENMKFNAVVGNPPYNVMDGGNKSSAKPIYNYFVETAIKINPEYISMITPSRWFNGGKGLDQFRANMVKDHRFVLMHDFLNAKDCFPTSSIGGGVNYFLWAKNYEGKCKFTNEFGGTENTTYRYLDDFDNFIRYNQAIQIIEKVLNLKEKNLIEKISSRNPFGLSTDIRGKEKEFSNSIRLYSSAGISYITESNVTQGKEHIDKYKIMISRLSAEHANEPDKAGKYRIISTMRILKPYEVCTDSYIIAYPDNNKNRVINCYNYLKTKFVRFLILQTLSSINMSRSMYVFVPEQDFANEWTDEMLYKKYDLTSEEIEFIESLIKPME